MLEGEFSKFERSKKATYSKESFKQSLHELMDKMNADRAEEIDHPSVLSRTFGAVTLLGGGFYVRFGASDWEVKYGFEQHAINADYSYTQAMAIQRLILFLMDKGL